VIEYLVKAKPHTGKDKLNPALPQGAANTASRSDTGLEGYLPQEGVLLHVFDNRSRVCG